MVLLLCSFQALALIMFMVTQGHLSMQIIQLAYTQTNEIAKHRAMFKRNYSVTLSMHSYNTYFMCCINYFY